MKDLDTRVHYAEVERLLAAVDVCGAELRRGLGRAPASFQSISQCG